MTTTEQPLFDLFSPEIHAENQALTQLTAESAASNANLIIENTEASGITDTTPERTGLSPKDQKRAIIGWLATQSPNSIGLSVPTRISRYKADVAAFWSEVKGKLLAPSKTMIIEVRGSREACWPDCSESTQLLSILSNYKKQRAELQETIRETEPNLRDMDTLFEEFQIWNYSQSTNSEYIECCQKIENIEEALYKGTRFQQISDATAADYLYLAVPAGEITVNEIADHWGLLYINDDMTVDVIQDAEKINCHTENQIHLIQNIARATYNSLLFTQGIQQVAEEEIIYTPIPRRRRAKKLRVKQSK